MKYFFVLGNNPTLSTAEISAVFPENQSLTLIDSILVLETSEKIDAEQVIKRLGGTIKIGEIVSKISGERDNILEEAKKLLKPGDSKFKFGISYYGKNKFNIKPVGMEIKKYLKKRGISCRWVTSRPLRRNESEASESVLSSVVVEQNKLTKKGVEIILIKIPQSPFTKGGAGGFLVGKTLAVQPFKELSFRDYGRPARDDRSGMLPPKLAQIMINLSGAETDDIILDPFCGSGTILTEAMLKGHKNLIGSDISKKAIEDTKKNIDWIKNNYELSITNYQLFNKSSTELSRTIKLGSIDVIVTEPYLGPQRGKINIQEVKKELEDLYSKSLSEFKKILKPNGRIVMIFPVFRETNYINPNLNGFKIINPISENLQKYNTIKLTNRNTIVYGRPGQKVWREIVILQK